MILVQTCDALKSSLQTPVDFGRFRFGRMPTQNIFVEYEGIRAD